MTERLQNEDVVLYPYLWAREQLAGETEGRKSRPVVVALRVERSDPQRTDVLLVAISSQPPRSDQTAIEIPQTELHRAGLDRNRSAWVYVDDFKTDVLEHSFYFDRGIDPIGRVSRSFLQQIAGAVGPLRRAGRGRVDRTL